MVKIGDEVQIIRKSDLASLRKSTAEEDKKAKKDTTRPRRPLRAKRKRPHWASRRSRRKVIVLQGSFKTEDDAKDWLEKHPQGQEGETKTGKKAAAQ